MRGYLLGWIGLAMGCGPVLAQTHVVRKAETVVRAVGVYEWTGDLAKPTASRLVPVTLFIDGKLEDAGVYLARPIPMVLETGTVFELDKGGVPAGTLDLSFARHLQPVDAAVTAATYDDGWFGYGKVTPQAALKPVVGGGKVRQSKAVLQVNGKPVGGEKVDAERPTMRRRDDAGSAGSGSTTAAAETPAADPDRPVLKKKDDASSADAKDAGTLDAGAKDADRPTMRKRDQSTDSTATTTDAKNEPAEDADRPTLKKRTPAEQKAAQKQRDQASVSGVGSLNDDPDRPVLHRGKPAGSMTEDDLPRLQGLPADTKQMVAVSDAATRPEHVFARLWESDAEREQVLGKMRELARARLAKYGTGLSVMPVVAKTAVAARRVPPRTKVAAAPVTLQDEDLKGYTLSYGGAPTYSFSASTPGPDAMRYVTIVAQAEPSGELKVAMDNVTDAAHLNRTPRLRLVDAVDAQASNRASLLFEMRAQDARWFALYRVIGAQAEQVFSSGSTQ